MATDNPFGGLVVLKVCVCVRSQNKRAFFFPSLQARCGDNPDGWTQLLRFLIRDAACRDAVHKLSLQPVATAAEHMRRQLATQLAEELSKLTVSQLLQQQTAATPPRCKLP